MRKVSFGNGFMSLTTAALLVSGFFVFAAATSASASISRVAVNTGYSASGNGTVSITSTTAGNILVVSIGIRDGSNETVPSVTDNKSDTYSAAWNVGNAAGGNYTTAIFYSANVPSGVTSVTVNNPAHGAGMVVNVVQYSGVATSSPLDVSSDPGHTVTGTSPYASGSVTTTQASELLVGYVINLSANDTITGTSGWSAATANTITSSGTTVGTQDRIVSSTGSYQNTGTSSSGALSYVGIATFKAGLSSDATLSNLTISAGTLTPSFASGTTSYTDSVANTVSSVTVTPTASQGSSSTIKVNGTVVASGTASGAISLNVGSNTITVLVTAPNGVTQDTYTITVTRAASSDATLSNLTISAGTLTPTFASGTISYTDSVANTVNSVTVTPTASQGSSSTIKVNGTVVASGSASGAISLNVGSNTITVLVTAPDGVTQDTYTITVTRAAASSISRVAVNTGYSASGNGTVSITSTTAGNFLVVSIGIRDGSNETVPSVTDNKSDSYSAAWNVGNAAGGNYTTAIFYSANVPAGVTSVTVNNPSHGAGMVVNVVQYSGVATSSPLDVSSDPGHTVTGTSPYASASVTTTQASEVLVGYVINLSANDTITGTNGWSAATANTITSSGTTVGTQDRIVSSTGSYQNTGTSSSGAMNYVGIATFKGDSGLSSDATLSNLTISSGTLTPTFASGTTSYTDSVANTVNSVTVTPTASQGSSSTIKVNGTVVASGSASGAISLNVGSNTITILVTAPNGVTQDTYTITVTRAASSDATLSSLTISAGTLTPTFASGTTSYTDSVANTVNSVTVTPTASQGSSSTIKVNGTVVASGSASGAISLNVGSNTITILVTAPDGVTQKTYTITVTRAASSDATLSNLTISVGALSPTFASGTTSYTDRVGNITNSVTVTPTASQGSSSTIKVNGTVVASGSASGAISLNVGSNTITVLVTAPDGVTQDTYTITVTRAASSDATLSNLTISAGTLTPTFASGTTSYTDSVGNATNSVTVTPTASQGSSSTIKVNGTVVASGSASGAITLNVGSNTITVLVTAPDGVTQDTYTITVTRAAAASLSRVAANTGYSASGNCTVSITSTTAGNFLVVSIGIRDGSNETVPSVTDNKSDVYSAAWNVGNAAGGNYTTAIFYSANVPAGVTSVTVNNPANGAGMVVNVVQYSGVATSSALDVSSDPTHTVTGSSPYASASVTTTQASELLVGYVINLSANDTITGTNGWSAATANTITSSGTTVGTQDQIVSSMGSYQNTGTSSSASISYVGIATFKGGSGTGLSSDATLSNLTISAGSLTPTFASGTTSYTDSVANAVSSVTVTPTASQGSSSTITVNGTLVASGSASGAISLNVGSNTITVLVTAPDGVTQDTYTVTVTRAASGGAMYYIDFQNGSDSNNGLSTSTPWKRDSGNGRFLPCIYSCVWRLLYFQRRRYLGPHQLPDVSRWQRIGWCGQ